LPELAYAPQLGSLFNTLYVVSEKVKSQVREREGPPVMGREGREGEEMRDAYLDLSSRMKSLSRLEPQTPLQYIDVT